MKIKDCKVTVEGVEYEISDWAIRCRVTDMFTNLFYYNRKNDEELRVGVMEECVKHGHITKQQIRDIVTEELDKAIEKRL